MPKVTERVRQEESGAETFLQAMEQGKIRLARFVLEALDGSIVNEKTECGRTPLMRAALLPEVRQRLRFVKLLLGNNAEVNRQDDHGRTALSHACECGTVDVVKLLVQSNADPEIVDVWGNSPLIYGALAGQTLVVEFLVRSFKRLGLDINRSNLAGNSAMEVAEYLGHHDCVRVLASHGRKWSDGEPSNGGPLEDITFKGSPYGQNQGPSITHYRERERRAQELLPVSDGKAKQVHGYKTPEGKCQSGTQTLQHDGGPPNRSCNGGHDISLNLNCFPKGFEMFSDIDQEYGDVCNLIQLIEPPVRREWENSSHGLKGKGQELLLPRVVKGDKINADCNGLLETQRLKIPKINGANLNSVMFIRERGSPECAPALSKSCREVQVKEKVNGGHSEDPRDIRALDKDAENQPIHGEQDSNMCVQGPQALSQRRDKGQDKTLGCLDGLSLWSHMGNSIALPTVGKEEESAPFAPQIHKKEIHNVTSLSSCFREGTLVPITGGRGLRSSHVYIGSMGNIEGQGSTSGKLSALESELKMCLSYVQTGIPNSETVVSLPPVAPQCPVTQPAPGSTTNLAFPRDIDSMLSEICRPEDEVLEMILKLSDCELEGLQVLDDTYYKKRSSLPAGSCTPGRKPMNPTRPPAIRSKAAPKTGQPFSVLRLFRRFTVPQLKTPAEDQEGFEGQAAGAMGGGGKRSHSETFPNSWQALRAGGKPSISGAKGEFDFTQSSR